MPAGKVRFFTTREAADILGVTAPTVIKWVKDGRMAAHRTPGGHRRIAASDLSTFAADCGYTVDGIGHAESTAPKRVSVLIVDREPDFAEMIAEYLQLKGLFDVVHADSGVQVGYYLGAAKPQVILYDVDSTSVDLREVVSLCPEARIILLTSMYNADVENLKAEFGAIPVVEKPVKLDKLLSIIRS